MENCKEISKTMYKSLENQFNAELLSAKSSLLVYFNNSVGIGEHPQHLEEMDKLIENIVSNKDKLECLQKQFASFNNLT